MSELLLQRDGFREYVHHQLETSRLGLLRWRGRIVEEGQATVRAPACVVLPGELDATAHCEVALLAAKTPHHRARLALELVNRPRISGRNQQVPVGSDIDRVDVEVVVSR